MSKAFTKETDDDDDPERPESLPADIINYMTPTGFSQLQDEMRQLLSDERPKLVVTVRWAAGNGDRSENGDYIYGKRRLREIDRRVRYLTKRLESARVVDPKLQANLTQVFFGATVTYQRQDASQTTVHLVGVDEADLAKGKISWISPVARALLKSHVGDVVELKTPSGSESVEIVEIQYKV